KRSSSVPHAIIDHSDTARGVLGGWTRRRQSKSRPAHGPRPTASSVIFSQESFEMPYPEYLVAPMRRELVDLGARECRTAADVDDAVKAPGVVMMVVNSVCGCAAGKARPGIAMALQ